MNGFGWNNVATNPIVTNTNRRHLKTRSLKWTITTIMKKIGLVKVCLENWQAYKTLFL